MAYMENTQRGGIFGISLGTILLIAAIVLLLTWIF